MEEACGEILNSKVKMLPERIKTGGFMMTNFDGIWYPDFMITERETINSIRDAVVGDDDILVATYPKSGTGWLLRILTLIKNNVDVNKTDSVPLAVATRMVELEKLETVLAEPEPRIIKTHMIYDHMPSNFRQRKNKIIYIARNAKDVSVSFYHHYKMLHGANVDETFEEFFERFMTGRVLFGSWSGHVKMFWEHRNDENLLWLTYEDLHLDIKKAISDIAEFWGKQLTEEQIDIVAKESSFETMSTKPTADYSTSFAGGHFNQSKTKYMRKGVVGDWKNYYTPEMNKRVDDMIEKEITPLGMKFHEE